MFGKSVSSTGFGSSIQFGQPAHAAFSLGVRSQVPSTQYLPRETKVEVNPFCEEEKSLEESKRRLSIFAEHDLVIKVDDTLLHVNRDQLMSESPVFKDMLSSAEYKDKNKALELEGKVVNTVVDFLRCTMPGIDEALTDKTVHEILPLADQYKTYRSLEKADTLLESKCKQLGNKISSEQIVKNILQAEKHQLVGYLEACIDIASRKCFEKLVKHPQFEEISKETRLKISLKRWNEMDEILKSSGRFTLSEETEDFYKPAPMPWRSSFSEARPMMPPNQDVFSKLDPFMTMN